MSLDVTFAREQFPALAGDTVFLDNAGGSQALSEAARRIADYLTSTNVQLGASYPASVTAGARVDSGRSAMARFMNAASPNEIVMGSSTTTLLKILARSVSSQLSAGDEVIVCNADHESNIGPWTELEQRGVRVRWWRADPESLELRLEDLEALLSSHTRLVCVHHVSNILGTVQPIREIADRVHASGAWLVVDGVAAAPHRRVDVRELDADFYVFSTYKVFGPHYAAMHGKAECLESLDGAYHYFHGKESGTTRLEPGNVSYETVYGCGAIVDYIEELGRRETESDDQHERIAAGYRAIEAHEAKLGETLLAYLRSRADVRIIGQDAMNESRVPTISFVVDGVDSRAVVEAVDPSGIGIRYGDFYARRLIEDLGLASRNGVVRVSMAHYNTVAEIERLVAVLGECLDPVSG